MGERLYRAGLILEGGGMRGVYTAGVLDAMDEAGLPLLGVIPEDPQVILAANTSKPLILFSRKGAAIAYLNIAKRIMGERVPLMKIR